MSAVGKGCSIQLRHRRLLAPDRWLAAREPPAYRSCPRRAADGLRRRGADVELVHHSDAGSRYTSIAFLQVLDDHRVLSSTGPVGDAYDTQSSWVSLDAVLVGLTPAYDFAVAACGVACTGVELSTGAGGVEERTDRSGGS